MRRVGGSVLSGAYYYAGIEPEVSAAGSAPTALTGFLDNLEMLPGYFVQRRTRRTKNYQCRECGAQEHSTHENEVDTTMAADMLRLAAVGAFDILVLMSGDITHATALESVRELGRQAYVATWGEVGLARRVRHTAFDHIDLLAALDECGRPWLPDVGDQASAPMLVPSTQTPSARSAPELPGEEGMLATSQTERALAELLIEEVRRAISKFPDGCVGVSFFITRWHAIYLPPDPELRRRLIDKLVQEERLEIYTTTDGAKALRLKRAAASSQSPRPRFAY